MILWFGREVPTLVLPEHIHVVGKLEACLGWDAGKDTFFLLNVWVSLFSPGLSS